MQVGSDGQACGTCHFHAGVDTRIKNQINPGTRKVDAALQNLFDPTPSGDGGPNYKLGPDDFPFHQLLDPEDQNYSAREVLFDSDDVVSSQGVFRSTFVGISGAAKDLGFVSPDSVFHVGAGNVRRVEPRNTPSMINAVFNFANFWDGRAHNEFNGVSVVGPLDQSAVVYRAVGNALVAEKVSLPDSSLASQAVGPPLSFDEMSFLDRSFPLIGRKLLALRPLGVQLVHPKDSVLGTYSFAFALPNGELHGFPGISRSYRALIQDAFRPKYWSSTATLGGFSQIELNFSLFFGLAIQMYEATLVSDATPFDAFMLGDDDALSQEELRGLIAFIRQPDSKGPLFTPDVGVGNCVACHGGPEFTDAGFTALAEGGDELELLEVEEMSELELGELLVGDETGFLDNGFSNIGVRPTGDDLGRGGEELGQPLSFARQALAGLSFAPKLPGCGAPDEEECPDGDRVAVDGAFKVPGLRNVALTGPYFHNGGQATLQQVVEFYDRRGDFGDVNIANLDRNMARIDIGEADEEPLVEFLMALTDRRVRGELKPFDHPELFVPHGHPGDHSVLSCVSGGQACDGFVHVRAVGAKGRAGSGMGPLKTFLNLPPFEEED
ncbi:MAG: cytochrome-c peroxidase [Planctomycetota bacterium]